MLAVEGARLLADLAHLAAMGADPSGGVSGVAYSAADIEARIWVRETMLGLGMQARRDEALNLIGRHPGRESHLKPLALGSHTDTVPTAAPSPAPPARSRGPPASPPRAPPAATPRTQSR